MAAVAAGEAAIGNVANAVGTRRDAFMKLTGPSPTASVHCEKSTVNPLFDSSANIDGASRMHKTKETGVAFCARVSLNPSF